MKCVTSRSRIWRRGNVYISYLSNKNIGLFISFLLLNKIYNSNFIKKRIDKINETTSHNTEGKEAWEQAFLSLFYHLENKAKNGATSWQAGKNARDWWLRKGFQPFLKPQRMEV